MKIKSLLFTACLLSTFFARVDSASATVTNILKIQHFQLLLKGTGAFSTDTAFTVYGNPGPNSIKAADVNGDGYLDIICDDGGSGVNVLTNDGAGNFPNYTDYNVGNTGTPNPLDVIAVDVNGDGSVDLISANNDEDSITVLTNDGTGNFPNATTIGVGDSPISLAYADIYGNGNPALISANEGNTSKNDTLTVLTNVGGGIFVSNASYVVGHYIGSGNNNPTPESVAAADVNNDGKIDLVCVDFFGYFGRITNNLIVLTNNGSGLFFSNAVYNVGRITTGIGDGPTSVKVFTNVDGKVDLVTANSRDNTLTVLTNNGSGHFGVYSNLSVGNDPLSVTVADVNGDGKPDLIAVNNLDVTLTVLTNNGGGFVLDTNIMVDANPYAVCAADVTGDGVPDLISADNDNGGTSDISVISAVPRISTNIVSGSIVLAWPTNNTAGYVLQQNSNLTATNNWVNVTNQQITLLGTNQVLDVLTPANRFYRLRHP
jgi:hypothetical protein